MVAHGTRASDVALLGYELGGKLREATISKCDVSNATYVLRRAHIDLTLVRDVLERLALHGSNV